MASIVSSILRGLTVDMLYYVIPSYMVIKISPACMRDSEMFVVFYDFSRNTVCFPLVFQKWYILLKIKGL